MKPPVYGYIARAVAFGIGATLAGLTTGLVDEQLTAYEAVAAASAGWAAGLAWLGIGYVTPLEPHVGKRQR